MEKIQRVKKILNSNITYILLFSVTAIYVIVNFLTVRTSIYDHSDREFIGVVSKRVVSDNKISFTLDSKEDLICNYYSDDEEEKASMWDEVSFGSVVKITGTLKEPSSNTIPNNFNYKEYLYNRGMFYTCTIEEITVMEKPANVLYIIKNDVVDRIMSFETKDYLYTMIVGDKSLLDEETFDKYRDNGVTHLFAISGMHIGLFAVIISGILKKCKIKGKKTDILVASFIWFYAFLAGFGASVVRAGLLFTYIAIDKIIGFKMSKIKILFLVLFTLVWCDYRIITDLGFIYSFVTTFGLIWASKIISKHKVIGTSLVANLFSLPITIMNFFKFNLASILFNILFVPFVSSIIYPLCLMTFFLRFLEPVLQVAIFVLEALNTACSQLQAFIFVVPAMSIIELVLYYVVLLVFIRANLYKVAIVLFTFVLLGKVKPYLDTHSHVEFLDVGQGDSTLIRSDHNKEVILIDTGGQVGTKSKYNVSDGTITYLNSLGIDRIDYLILTHGDTDHLGDAMNVLRKIEVKNVILNKGDLNAKEIEIIRSGANVTQEYDGILRLESLNDKDWNDENASSIVLQLQLSGHHFLFMGDAGKEVETYIVSKYKIHAEVVKLGHHGSKTSSGYGFLKSVGCETGIISSGRKNRYNHPSPETIDTLDRLGIEYYNTQETGSILYEIGKDDVTVSTYPP